MAVAKLEQIRGGQGVGISNEDQMKILSMLTALLWLGNISFFCNRLIDNKNYVEVV